MKVENNLMVGVNYTLTVNGEIVDQSREGAPLEFIFGAGMLLPKFEEAVAGKEIGDKVSFTLEPQDGYGEYKAEAVVDLPENIFFNEEGKIADAVYPGAMIPMSTADGHQMMGIVVEFGEGTVKMDFNPPMAGKTLNFDVEVVSIRETTPEDMMPKGGCSSCGEGGCDDGCCGDCGCN